MVIVDHVILFVLLSTGRAAAVPCQSPLIVQDNVGYPAPHTIVAISQIVDRSGKVIGWYYYDDRGATDVQLSESADPRTAAYFGSPPSGAVVNEVRKPLPPWLSLRACSPRYE